MATHSKEDLRTALDTLRDKNELAEVRGEVHWNRELGTLTREALRRKAPALLFTNITGYTQPDTRCARLATSMLASHRRIALLTGFGEPLDHCKLISRVRRKNQERVKPELVEHGEVQDTVV